MDIEQISFQLILHGGNAKSSAMEAIFHAKEGNFTEAETSLKEANDALREAHKQHAGLIQKEASGEQIDIRLLFIHAEDHLMNAVTTTDLAKEIIDLHKRFQENQKEG